jgi:hypothetical protein
MCNMKNVCHGADVTYEYSIEQCSHGVLQCSTVEYITDSAPHPATMKMISHRLTTRNKEERTIIMIRKH